MNIRNMHLSLSGFHPLSDHLADIEFGEKSVLTASRRSEIPGGPEGGGERHANVQKPKSEFVAPQAAPANADLTKLYLGNFQRVRAQNRRPTLQHITEPSELSVPMDAIYQYEGIEGVSATFLAILTAENSNDLNPTAVLWFEEKLSQNPEFALGILQQALDDANPESMLKVQLLYNGLPISTRKALLNQIPDLKDYIHEAMPKTIASKQKTEVAPTQVEIPANVYRRSSFAKGTFGLTTLLNYTAYGAAASAFFHLDTNHPVLAVAAISIGALYGFTKATEALKSVSIENEANLPVQRLDTDQIGQLLVSFAGYSLAASAFIYFILHGTPYHCGLGVGVFGFEQLVAGLYKILAVTKNASIKNQDEVVKNKKEVADTQDDTSGDMPEKLKILLKGYKKLSLPYEKEDRIAVIGRFKHPAAVALLKKIAITKNELPFIREAASEALSNIPLNEARLALYEISTNENILPFERETALELAEAMRL
jgi:hypothetical protein